MAKTLTASTITDDAIRQHYRANRDVRLLDMLMIAIYSHDVELRSDARAHFAARVNALGIKRTTLEAIEAMP